MASPPRRPEDHNMALLETNHIWTFLLTEEVQEIIIVKMHGHTKKTVTLVSVVISYHKFTL